MSAWNKEGIDDRLKYLVEETTKSYSEIAVMLREEYHVVVSRGACIGRARRNGVVVPVEKKKYHGKSQIGVAKPRRRGDNGGSTMRAIQAKLIREEPAPLPEIKDDDIPIEQRKTLFELTSETCRWPVGEGAGLFFCGAVPVDGRPYCDAHCARAYTRVAYTSKPYVELRRRAA